MIATAPSLSSSPLKIALVFPTPEQVAGVRRITNDYSGSLRYTVPSRSAADHGYVVTCPRGAVPVEYQCSCPWGASGRIGCRHVGAVVEHLRQMIGRGPQPDRSPLTPLPAKRTAWIEEV